MISVGKEFYVVFVCRGVNIMLFVFLSRCDGMASWAAQYTTVCLDLQYIHNKSTKFCRVTFKICVNDCRLNFRPRIAQDKVFVITYGAVLLKV